MRDVLPPCASFLQTAALIRPVRLQPQFRLSVGVLGSGTLALGSAQESKKKTVASVNTSCRTFCRIMPGRRVRFWSVPERGAGLSETVAGLRAQRLLGATYRPRIESDSTMQSA